MVFLRDERWPGGAHVPAAAAHARAAPARASRDAGGHARHASGPASGGPLARSVAVQAFNRIGEAVTASASRQAGQEGATRVTRRRAALTWLP